MRTEANSAGRTHWTWGLLATGALALGTACGGGSTGPSHVVTAVTVTGGRDTLYVGQSMTLGASVQLDSSTVVTADSVGWTSSDSTKARVSATGVVSAVAAGTATITASIDGHSGVKGVTVRVIPVVSVTVSPSARIVYLGQGAQLTATPKDSAGTTVPGLSATWVSRDTSVASVSGSGMVTPHDTGLVRVVATISGHSDSAAVTVGLVPVTSITLLPAGDTAQVGDTLRPVIVAKDSSGAPIVGRTTTLSVSDSAVLQPIGGGAFVAAANGAATLTATVGSVSKQGAVSVLTCGDTAQIAANAFDFPHVAGQLARGVSSTLDVGLFGATPVIYGGGVMFGTDSTHMLVSYDPRGDIGDGAAHVGVCALTRSGVAGYTYTKVRPVAGEGMPPGLRVVEESFANSTPGADSGFVLFRYTFTDTSTSAVSGLRVGYFVDWDLNFTSSTGDDILRYYPGLAVGEAEESDTLTYPARFAVVPVEASGTPTYSGWVNGSGTTDPSTRGGYFARLAGGTLTSTLGPTDIRQLSGAGPLAVPAGGRVVVYFALVGGADPTAFAASRAAAEALASSLGFN